MNETQDRIDLFEYLVELGHDEKRVASFLKNLKKDGLLELVEKALSGCDNLKKFVQTVKLLDPTLFGSEDPASRLELMIQHLLSSMVEDEYYNRKILFNRKMFLRSTIEQYEQRFVKLIEEINNMMQEVSQVAAETLKTKTKNMMKKCSSLLDKMDELGLEPIELKDELLRIEKGLKSVINGEITPETLTFYIENLPRLMARLDDLEAKCIILFQKKEKLEEHLEKIKQRFEELEKVSEKASQAGLKLSFVEEYLSWKDVLVSRIRDKCKKAGPECYDDAISSAKELEKELSQLLVQSESISSLLEKRIELFEALKEVEKEVPKLDSLIGTSYFSNTVKSLKKDLNSVSGIESILESAELDSLVQKAESVLKEIKLLVELSKAIKELEKIPEDSRKTQRVKRQIQKLAEILESDIPLEKKVQDITKRVKDLVRGARATEEVLQDLLRLYPIWRRRILSLVRERGSVSIGELKFVPPRWRKWVVERIVKEVGDISMSGDSLVLAGALTPVGVSIEVARQKAAAFEEVLRGLEEFLGTELSEERRGLEHVKQLISSIEGSSYAGEDSKAMEETLIEVNRTLELLANMLRKKMIR